MLTLTTNRYQSHRAEHGAAIRTTVGAPRFRLPYDLAGQLHEVTPDRPWLRLPWPAYVIVYRQRLEDLGLPGFLRSAQLLADRAETDRLDLLCFCVDAAQCHRGLLRAWLIEGGLDVTEASPVNPTTDALF